MEACHDYGTHAAYAPCDQAFWCTAANHCTALPDRHVRHDHHSAAGNRMALGVGVQYPCTNVSDGETTALLTP